MSPRRFCLLILLLSSASPVRGEVIHGFQTLRPTWVNMPPFSPYDDAIDFSTQSVVSFLSDEADISYGEEIRGEGWLFVAGGGDGLASVESPLGDVSTAPLIPLEFTQAVQRDRTYVTRTADGLYAKFAVHEWNVGGCCSMVIEYYVQMDGTASFGPSLPIRSATWGSIKALYR